MNESEYGQKYRDHYYELYKLAVEMADRVSQRRAQANSFFITANTGLLAAVSVARSISEAKPLLLFVAVGLFGILLCLSWLITINSYRQLNSGKFHVILEMEKSLPHQIYKDEWKFLGEGADAKKYRELTRVERNVPFLFSLPYIIIIILAFV